MKYLTIDYIKAHSRIDCDCEDELLDLYGTAAEDTVLNYIGCTLDELKGTYGDVPAPIIQATMMLAESSYVNRSPSSAQNLSVVPYGFDFLLKPYMIL